MKIDGKKIADSVLTELKKDLKELSSRKIIPHFAVVLVGSDKSSKVYVKQKVKTASLLGIKIDILTPPVKITLPEFIKLINGLNRNDKIHAVIIQRPLPFSISAEKLDLLVAPQKDVDGFHPGSVFDPPVALAVMKILESLHPNNFLGWLKSTKILVIGRGATAGKPIAKYLSKINLEYTVAHSQTPDLRKLIKTFKIIISCVGKSNIVRHNDINSNSFVIGVGLHVENGKLQPDYDQKLIADNMAYFTPVPGGVGPVNVAMLMKNVVRAAGIQATQ